jgi:DNA-binding NarL/FixJ family response regulator
MGDLMPHRLRAFAFDLDAASLTSLREALPGAEIEVVNGATAASLSHHWNPGAADLLVVQAHEQAAETLGLCRFLVFSGVFGADFREEGAEALERYRSQRNRTRRAAAPLLVLVPAEQESLVKAALEAGAHSCLMLPINAKDVASMLVHALAGNQPGRHTLNLEGAQSEDRWRDDGGQG